MASPPDDPSRVSINGIAYEIRDAGTNRYAVYDEFGGHLGYFEMRGKAVVPDDYGVEGAPAIVTIAKEWIAASGPVLQKPSFQVCRIAKAGGVDELVLTRAKAYVAWLKQCGAKAAFLTHDAEAKTLSTFSVWGSSHRLASALEKQAPIGAAEPDGATVEVQSLVQDL